MVHIQDHIKNAMELAKILGPPNYVSYNYKGMVEFVKWQKELNTDNFVYGAFLKELI